MGADAPNATTRKAIGGGWEILRALQRGFGAVVYLLLGGICLYGTAMSELDWKIFGVGVGALALAALLFKWAARRPGACA